MYMYIHTCIVVLVVSVFLYVYAIECMEVSHFSGYKFSASNVDK